MYQNNFTHTVEPALSSHPRGMAKSPLNLGGNSAQERGGDARRKFRTKPLKETDWAWPTFFLLLKETMLRHRQMKNTVTFNDGRHYHRILLP